MKKETFANGMNSISFTSNEILKALKSYYKDKVIEIPSEAHLDFHSRPEKENNKERLSFNWWPSAQ